MPSFTQTLTLTASSTPIRPVNVKYVTNTDTSLTMQFDYLADPTGIIFIPVLFFPGPDFSQSLVYPGPETAQRVGATNTWIFTMSGLTPNTEYDVIFYARNAEGEQINSELNTYQNWVGTYGGTISPPTVIFGNSPAPGQMNYVITGDGFDSSTNDQNAFNLAAQQAVDAITAEAAYWNYLPQISITRLNTQANVSGIPATTPATANNLFGSYNASALMFCNNSRLVQKVWSIVPAACIIISLANRFGGGGGLTGGFPAMFSDHPALCLISTIDTTQRYQPILLHELGHATGAPPGVYDEYGGTLGTGFSGPEFTYVNVTINTDRSTLKWANRILDSTPIPTLTNSNCSLAILADPSQPDVVGLFETGGGFNCGVYRPTAYCYMHGDGAPYCVVCEDAIVTSFRTVTNQPAPVTPQPTNLTLAASTSSSLTFQWNTDQAFVYDQFTIFLAFYKTFVTFVATGAAALVAPNTWQVTLSLGSGRYMFAVEGHSASGWSRVTYGSNKGFVI